MTPTEQLREAIRESGISQYALAKETEVPQSRISDFLSGRAIASDNFDRLAKAMGLELRRVRKPKKGNYS